MKADWVYTYALIRAIFVTSYCDLLENHFGETGLRRSLALEYLSRKRLVPMFLYAVREGIGLWGQMEGDIKTHELKNDVKKSRNRALLFRKARCMVRPYR